MARVLAVDDEPGLRMVYRLMLTKMGHSVRCARNVEEAKSQIQSEMPEVLILDYLMPDGNGNVLLDWLSAQRLSLPVVMISGQVGTHHLGLAPDNRIIAYMGKPFRHNVLASVIDQALNAPPAQPLG